MERITAGWDWSLSGREGEFGSCRGWLRKASCQGCWMNECKARLRGEGLGIIRRC